jgi:secretion/DNA translocation related TadE-like protein
VGVARHRAAGVADLAALAAADRAHLGAGRACAVAEGVAAAAGASLLGCRLDGPVAEVTAQVRPVGRLGELGAATARARAGPLDPPAGQP